MFQIYLQLAKSKDLLNMISTAFAMKSQAEISGRDHGNQGIQGYQDRLYAEVDINWLLPMLLLSYRKAIDFSRQHLDTFCPDIIQMMRMPALRIFRGGALAGKAEIIAATDKENHNTSLCITTTSGSNKMNYTLAYLPTILDKAYLSKGKIFKRNIINPNRTFVYHRTFLFILSKSISHKDVQVIYHYHQARRLSHKELLPA